MNKKLILAFAINFINSAPGDLDTSFGTNGIATASGKDLSGLALYSNQKIIVAGSNTDEDKGIFIRFLTDGTVDTTFATSGTLSLSNNVIGLQPSVATYLGNRIFPGGHNSVEGAYELFAYDNNGDSISTVRSITSLVQPYATIVDSNDKIISMSKSTGNNLTVCKDGFNTSTDRFVIETNFGTNGVATFDGIGLTANGAPSGVAVNSDNDIFVCYYQSNSDTNFRISKINGSDGTLDTGFNTTGSAIIGTELGAAKAVAIQSDGKVILVGGGDSFIVMRLNTDGSLDTTFNADGDVPGLIIDSNLQSGQSVVIQDDGKIIAGGKSSDGTSFGLARYNSDGTIDTTFGENGYVSTPSGSSGAVRLALQDDGKLIAAGSNELDNFIIARYLTSEDVNYLTANASSESIAKNTPKNISISGSNSQSTDLLTFAISSQPSNGTLGSITQPRKTGSSQAATLIYTPNANFTGTDSFAFTITDGSITSEPATVTLNVSNFGNLNGFVQRLIEKY